MLLKAGGAVLLVLAGGAVAVASQRSWLDRQAFSELSVRAAGADAVVRLRNQEGERVQYTVTVRATGRPGRRLTVAIADGASWEQRLRALERPRPALTVTVDRRGAPSPYRIVRLRAGEQGPRP